MGVSGFRWRPVADSGGQQPISSVEPSDTRTSQLIKKVC
jgi:hypothetical protein